TDLSNNSVAGVLVNFAVTGVNPTTGTGFTDQNGQAVFCYNGANAGSDLIRATAAGTSATATKSWGTSPNQPPAVSAGPAQTITLPTNAVTLNGVATDDGLPLGSSLTVTWSKVSGPSGVAFANSGVATTTATFQGAGTYVLQLTASDSQLTASDSVTITVLAAPVNRAPFVDRGPGYAVNFEANLVANQDCDANPTQPGQIPNWTTVSGAWQRAAAASGVTPFNGDYDF